MGFYNNIGAPVTVVSLPGLGGMGGGGVAAGTSSAAAACCRGWPRLPRPAQARAASVLLIIMETAK